MNAYPRFTYRPAVDEDDGEPIEDTFNVFVKGELIGQVQSQRQYDPYLGGRAATRWKPLGLGRGWFGCETRTAAARELWDARRVNREDNASA